MSLLIMMRHGQSEWNQLNQFTGWVDIPLSEEGAAEARAAGALIRDIPIDIIYTSTLVRAQMTLLLAMLNHSSGKVPQFIHHDGKQKEWARAAGAATDRCIPTICAWQLNERMYGELQGLNKKELADKYGKEQVQVWRRSYDTPPPGGESLKMTAERAIPYFEEKIVPHLSEGKNVLISAHGNSLRAIVMEIERLSKEEIVALEIPTGVPMAYMFKEGHFTQTQLPTLDGLPRASESSTSTP